jgi:hypothetical protein
VRRHTLYTGSIARAADGTDLSLPAGILISTSVYLLMRRSLRAADAALRTSANEPRVR